MDAPNRKAGAGYSHRLPPQLSDRRPPVKELPGKLLRLDYPVAMKRFQAVIFDMDGVIVDSEPRHERAFREVFDAMGYGETHGMCFPDYYGRSDRALWMDFIARHQPVQTLEELSQWKQSRFLEIIRREQPIFEGLPELLAKLKPRYRLAVASGSLHPVIDEVLAWRDLRRFFPVVVSVQDVPRGKPAPDVFLHTASLLGVPPSECCVIEDSAAGVDAALAGGMSAIAITNTLPEEKLAHATRVVKSYAEIESLLLAPFGL
jgi:HAD superfamily hydrolase (TIGR01509 family)